MKTFMVLVVCLMLAMVPATLMAAEAGMGYYESGRLISAATGTTSAYTTGIYTFRHPVTSVACDFSATPATAWTVLMVGNTGYSSVFNAGINGSLMASAQTVTTATNGSSFVKSPTLIQSIQAVVTAATTTQVVTVRCTGAR